jgi:hypothetical protein
MNAAIGEACQLGDLLRRPEPQLEPLRPEPQAEERSDVYCRTLT